MLRCAVDFLPWIDDVGTRQRPDCLENHLQLLRCLGTKMDMTHKARHLHDLWQFFMWVKDKCIKSHKLFETRTASQVGIETRTA